MFLQTFKLMATMVLGTSALPITHAPQKTAAAAAAAAVTTLETKMTHIPKKPAFAWCRTASIQDDGVVKVQSISSTEKKTNHHHHNHDETNINNMNNINVVEHHNENGWSRSIHQSRMVDITKSSDWMEYIEYNEGRINDDGGAGAYDTMRCDILIEPRNNNDNNKETVIQLNNDDTNRDLTCSITLPPRTCRIWGESFHLNRLKNSYLALKRIDDNTIKINNNVSAINDSSEQEDKSTNTTTHISTTIDHTLEVAMKESKIVLHQLLTEAVSSIPSYENCDKQNMNSMKSRDRFLFLVRATLLWSSNKEEVDDNKVIVRGHACCSCKPIDLYTPPTPIVASIAAYLKGTTGQSSKDGNYGDSSSATTTTTTTITTTIGASIDESLPTRFQNPNTKIASWCRLRQKLERPAFKPPEVAEVLMVRPIQYSDSVSDSDITKKKDDERRHLPHQIIMENDDLELLEGLSSNVFVIYKNGTLRTPRNGVLHGYVRHLVLDNIQHCGLTWDPRPILLHEAEEYWKEVFITSSSRLIIPVSKILIPAADAAAAAMGEGNDGVDQQSGSVSDLSSFTEFWRDPVLLLDDKYRQDTKLVTPKWQQLLDRIIDEHNRNNKP